MSLRTNPYKRIIVLGVAAAVFGFFLLEIAKGRPPEHRAGLSWGVLVLSMHVFTSGGLSLAFLAYSIGERDRKTR